MPRRRSGRHVRARGALEHLVDVADRLVAAWSALPTELVGLISLFPLLNPISDLIVCNELISGGHYGAAVAVGLILLAHWRFLALYAALTPLVGYGTSITLYVPFQAAARTRRGKHHWRGGQCRGARNSVQGSGDPSAGADDRSEGDQRQHIKRAAAIGGGDAPSRLAKLADATDLESGGPGWLRPFRSDPTSAASPPGRAARPLRKPASPGGSKPGAMQCSPCMVWPESVPGHRAP